MFPDGDRLGREYLAKDSLDLGAHSGDVGHYDCYARCVSCCGQFVLYPVGTGRDLVPFIDCFDERLSPR